MNQGAVAASCDDVWFAYRKGDWVLRGVSLSVLGGSFVCVLGKSGAGKTTLVKVMAGLDRKSVV